MGGYRLLCFVKGKMAKFWCFIMFICLYIHSFVFREMVGRGATASVAPLNLPLKLCVYFVVTIMADFQISCPCNSTLASAYVCWITH